MPDAAPESLAADAGKFATTHWSVVLNAGRADDTRSREALARLCQTYWYPLYAFVRRRGHGLEEAQDLTQGFFGRLLEKKLFQAADPERGRFRSFMLASLSNFLNNHWDRAHTARRGAGCEIVSWDAQSAEERYLQEPFHEETPEKMFERRWALTVLDQALAMLREEYGRGGKGELFEALHVCLSGGRAAEPYVVLGARLGLSEAAVKVAVHRVRRRFAAALRQVIAQTLGREEDVDEELRHLVSMMG